MTSSRSLIVSRNHRRLERLDGTPFFYLADTAWEIAQRLTREEVVSYLDVRAAQSFNVIQVMALVEHHWAGPNRYGHAPLKDLNPATPNEAYFEHLDFIVQSANERGIVVALLPTWGDKVNSVWGEGPEIFNPTNARAWGQWMGNRYKEADIIWVVGGDRPITNETHLTVWREMAAGLSQGDGGRHLKTFHPNGGCSSSQYVHAEPWLDFNMIQTGHSWPDVPGWEAVRHDLSCYPAKPTVDGEPRYEDHPVMANRTLGTWGYFGELEVRKAMYHALLAGACGHTYGCHPVWQFYDPARGAGINRVRTPWQAAIHLPGANQVRHARKLMLSRSWDKLLPDQNLLYEFWGWGDQHRQAARTADRRHMLVYLSDPRPVTIITKQFASDSIYASWFDPRTGDTQADGCYRRQDRLTFTPPVEGDGPDWVLCLDDVPFASANLIATDSHL